MLNGCGNLEKVFLTYIFFNNREKDKVFTYKNLHKELQTHIVNIEAFASYNFTNQYRSYEPTYIQKVLSIYHVNLNVAKVLRNLSNMHPKVIEEDFALKKPLKNT